MQGEKKDSFSETEDLFLPFFLLHFRESTNVKIKKVHAYANH